MNRYRLYGAIFRSQNHFLAKSKLECFRQLWSTNFALIELLTGDLHISKVLQIDSLGFMPIQLSNNIFANLVQNENDCIYAEISWLQILNGYYLSMAAEGGIDEVSCPLCLPSYSPKIMNTAAAVGGPQ